MKEQYLIKPLKHFPYLLVLIALALTFYALDNELQVYRDLEIRGDTTVCTIIDSVPLVKVKYTVEGKDYISGGIDTHINGYQEGEQFKIVYDPENFEKYKVLFWMPVILEDEFEETFAIKIRTKFLNSKLISFDFYVDDKKYSRGQRLPPSIDSDTIDKDFRVKYNKKNPEIAYMIIP